MNKDLFDYIVTNLTDTSGWTGKLKYENIDSSFMVYSKPGVKFSIESWKNGVSTCLLGLPREDYTDTQRAKVKTMIANILQEIWDDAVREYLKDTPPVVVVVPPAPVVPWYKRLFQ